MKIVIGSRGSKLALQQSNSISNLLAQYNTNNEICIKVIKTSGDIQSDGNFNIKSTFTKEIEDQLIKKNIDMAVHSLKDMSVNLVNKCIYFGSPQREDPRDVFVSTKYNCIDEVPDGGIIGTGSNRRKSQLLSYNKNFIIKKLNGNVDTRLNKLEANQWDGIITAAAAMHRLNLKSKITQYLDPLCFVPAGGQGALGIEILSDSNILRLGITNIIDRTTTKCCKAERLYLREMNAGCNTTIGCWARLDQNKFKITAYAASNDGAKVIKKTLIGKLSNYKNITIDLAKLMISLGAKEIINC